MSDSDEFRSFADPNTELRLEVSDTPVNVDGFKLGESTGRVTCLECGSSASTPEYIAYDGDCDQSDVMSEYYEAMH